VFIANPKYDDVQCYICQPTETQSPEFPSETTIQQGRGRVLDAFVGFPQFGQKLCVSSKD
jgi:hypothetical protein